MARINSYPLDATIQDKDAWIGSDSVTRATKQYTAAAVAKYLNISAKISISGQMIFKFVDSATDVGDFSGPASGSAMTAITTMQLSTVDVSTQNVVAFMTYLVGNNILINEQNDISIFGHYKINSYIASGAGFYTLNLTNIGGSGNLTGKLFYDFAVFTLPSDKPSPFQFNATSTTGIESNNNTASGLGSLATGNDTRASGFFSFTTGTTTKASQSSSTAMGNATEASGNSSTAMGLSTKASGIGSTAMGSNTTASGSFSTAMGTTTVASGGSSTAIGSGAEASGFSSLAMGTTTTASGDYSLAMGLGTTASGFNSTTTGNNTVASGYASTAMGNFNVLNTADNATAYSATNTAFSIGNGTTNALRSDAFKVLFNGTTTIGTSTPIGGSMFAVNRTSAATLPTSTVGIFNEFNYTGSSSSIDLFGGVTRNQYSGSDNIDALVGANLIARVLSSSSGVVKEIIGALITSEHKGSGDVLDRVGITGAFAQSNVDSSSNFSTNQVIGDFVITRILNTGTQTITNQVTGSASKVIFNNPNATSASTLGSGVSIEAVKGDMGDTSVLYLNMGGNYDNPDASLSIDNFAYIKADDNFAMPNVTGTSHFINSSVPLPSVFAGSVTSESLNVTALNTAPASATATGTLGSIKFTADHIYVCVATNTWKRVAIATF